MSQIQIGRLLSANTRQFLVGCAVSQFELPTLGALTQVEVSPGYIIYGLIYDIFIADDGLVRQLVTAPQVDASVIADHRINRSVPLEIQVLSLGFQQEGQIFHLLPPRPPLGLEAMRLCSEKELVAFTSAGRFGYLRHILREKDEAMGEVLAAHLQQAGLAHQKMGKPEWAQEAVQEIIILLRDDYATLIRVLQSLADSLIFAK